MVDLLLEELELEPPRTSVRREPVKIDSGCGLGRSGEGDAGTVSALGPPIRLKVEFRDVEGESTGLSGDGDG